MKSLFQALILILVSAPLTARAAEAPHIGYVYPAGGQAGTTFKVKVGGQYLENVKSVHFMGGNVTAKTIKYTEAPTTTLNKLRREMRQVEKRLIEENQEQQNESMEQEKMMDMTGRDNQPGMETAGQTEQKAEIKKQDKDKITLNLKKSPELKSLRTRMRDVRRQIYAPKKQPNAQIEETVDLEITIAPDAEPGKREIRLITKLGLSNPLSFYIGQLPEVNERQAVKTRKRNKKIPPLLLSSFPVLLNGQVMPGEADRFRIKTDKGEHLVFIVQARALIPYLADAVPGWFQAVLTLYDAKGKEVAFTDDYKFNPDPVLFYNVPADGEYILEIRDSIYRGREDFVYRITIGELPFIANIFPLGGRIGEETTIRVYGKNLPIETLNIKPASGMPRVYLKSIEKQGISSNRFKFAADNLPEDFEKEPNNDFTKAQPVKLPLIVNGRIGRAGDWDVFYFEGRAGQEIVAEVYARRLNSSLDSVLKIIDSNGKVLKMNDDNQDRGAGLTTHHADSYLRCKLPSDGTYYVSIGDIQNNGGRSYAYRLHISRSQPDFELRAVPSGVNIPPGGSGLITIHALRKDGFSGPINLSAQNLPKGFSMSRAVIPEDKDKICLTFSAPADASPGAVTPRITGAAQVNGRIIKHNVVPAEDQMQAFLYRHLVTTKELVVMVTDPAPVTVSVTPPPGGTLKIPSNGQANFIIEGMFKIKGKAWLKLSLNDPPEGITMNKAGISSKSKSKKRRIIIKADENVKPGMNGNLILTGIGRKGRQKYMFTLPAVPFEIVDKTAENNKEKKTGKKGNK